MEMVKEVIVAALGRYFNCCSDKIMLTLEADFVRLPANNTVLRSVRCAVSWSQKALRAVDWLSRYKRHSGFSCNHSLCIPISCWEFPALKLLTILCFLV